MSSPFDKPDFMHSAIAWQYPSAAIAYDVLSSMISELIAHHERTTVDDGLSLDWVSPKLLTRIVKYANSSNLSPVLNQEPESVAAEYQLIYRDVPIFSWCEYRWPHLREHQPAEPDNDVYVPSDCFDELMQYHVEAQTSWLQRYRARSRGLRVAKIDEVRIVAEPDRVEML